MQDGGLVGSTAISEGLLKLYTGLHVGVLPEALLSVEHPKKVNFKWLQHVAGLGIITPMDFPMSHVSILLGLFYELSF